jgi:hypothetical protein
MSSPRHGRGAVPLGVRWRPRCAALRARRRARPRGGNAPRWSAAMAGEAHPVPFRTRKLSPRAPMVLRGKPVGEQGAADQRGAFAVRGPGRGQPGRAPSLPRPPFVEVPWRRASPPPRGAEGRIVLPRALATRPARRCAANLENRILRSRDRRRQTSEIRVPGESRDEVNFSESEISGILEAGSERRSQTRQSKHTCGGAVAPPI